MQINSNTIRIKTQSGKSLDKLITDDSIDGERYTETFSTNEKDDIMSSKNIIIFILALIIIFIICLSCYCCYKQCRKSSNAHQRRTSPSPLLSSCQENLIANNLETRNSQ